MTKADIARRVEVAAGMPKVKAIMAVDAVLDQCKQGLARDGVAHLRGFAVFKTRKRGRRVGRNPKTGKAAFIHPKTVPTCKFSKRVKDKVNTKVES